MQTLKETSNKPINIQRMYEDLVQYSPPEPPLSPEYHTNPNNWFVIVHRIEFTANGIKRVVLPRAVKSIHCVYMTWSASTNGFWHWWYSNGRQWSMSIIQWYIWTDRFIHTWVWYVVINSITANEITFETFNRTATIYANLYCY